MYGVGPFGQRCNIGNEFMRFFRTRYPNDSTEIFKLKIVSLLIYCLNQISILCISFLLVRVSHSVAVPDLCG